MQQFHTIVIGAGPGGYELAAMLAAAGERVAIVERAMPGGTCLNCGCIPTKCLAASADTLRTARDGAPFGVICHETAFDYGRARSRMLDVMEALRQGVMTSLRDVTYIEGEARLRPGLTVDVGSDTVVQAGRRVVIATGSEPARLRVPGAELAIDSTAALSLEALPESAVIVGGGVIGMELASIWHTMGVKVTVLEYCPEILPGFDSDTAKRLRSALSRKGITIATGASVTEIKPGGEVLYTTRRGEASVCAEVVVAAVGRRPVIPDGTADCGVELTARGFIKVDESMRTTAEGIYAIGDVNGLSMLAHSATAQARVVAHTDPAQFNARCVPAVVFTHPEVAQVGIVPEGEDTFTVKRMFGSLGKAMAMGQADGYVRAVCRKTDGVPLQISIIGPHAAELIAEATMLVADGVPLSSVASRYIHAHPTLSEIFA